MGLANLFVVPRNPDQLRQWSFNHMAHHRDVLAYTAAKYSVSIPEFVLDPIPVDTGAWAVQHQLMHNIQDALLNIPGYDLSEPDFTKPDSMQSWIWLNADLHRQEADITGIS